METILLEDFDDLQNSYYWSEEPDFAFCSKEKDGKAELLTQFAYCRETVAGDVFAKISGNLNDRRASFYHRIEKIPVDKTCVTLRLIIATEDYVWDKQGQARINKLLQALDETFPKSVTVALHILNLIEDKYGWDRTTAKLAKIVKHGVDMKPMGSKAKMKTACFTADKKWIRSPHMLSLFLLIIRCVFTTRTSLNTLLKIKTFDKLIEFFTKMRCKYEDGKFIRSVAKYIPVIFTNFDKIFGRSMAKNFNPKSYKGVYDHHWGDYSTYITEGICTLCGGRSGNLPLSRAFATLSKDPKVIMEVAATADDIAEYGNNW